MTPSLAAMLSEAAALHKSGATAEAAARYRAIVQADPSHADALYHLAQICCQQGRFDEGVDLVRRALALEPQRARSHVLLGRALAELGGTHEALASFDRAIACDGEYAGAHGNRGDLLARIGRLPEAVESYRRANAIEAGSMANWCNLGAAQAELGHRQEALASYERAIALEPMFLEGHVIRGNLLTALGRHADALASYDRALAIAPGEVSVLTRRADVLVALKRPEEALASLDRALAMAPLDVDVLSNRGFLLQSLNRYGEALATFDRALRVSPSDVRVHRNRSKTLFGLNRDKEALANAERALAIDPADVESLYTRGMLLGRLHRYDEAIAAFERVLDLAPAHPHALAQLAWSCQAICAWDKFAAIGSPLYDAMAAGTAIVSPGILLQCLARPDVILAAARRYVEHEIPVGPKLEAAPAPSHTDKIRVAYLSGDFRVHPVAFLTAELFECHDRRRFEVIGLSIGPDDKSDMRARIAKSFDQFYDVRTAGDREVAELIRRLGVDIVVDLSGHTDNSRSRIMRYRAAPVQVNYLGYAGTMGADFIDYIVADKTVLPFDQQPHYAEMIVHLPDCFMVNDTTKAISPHTPSRAEAGLPPSGFVFCCFNNAYKVTAEIFRVWLRLLTRVDGSVLWMSLLNSLARENLHAAARAAGVDPARIVFAPRKPAIADHFARQRLAGLFLDTPGYNAHTTASDALWAGLPVLTCMGSTFSGRVAASLLRAVGLPELVTHTLDDYEALALKLAREPALLAELRQRLQQNRLTYPLFDTDRFARHIERAYETMHENKRQGRGPQSFSVEPIDMAGR